MKSELTTNNTAEANVITATDLVQHIKLSRQMPRVLVGAIDQKIIDRAVEQNNIVLSEQELQAAADGFRYENKLISSAATLNWLNKYHLSVTEFEKLIENGLVVKKLIQHLFQSQVEAYFYAHQLDYYRAVIYDIVLSDFDLGMELYYGIQEEELSFWNLAHEYIQDRELRRRGGYQGKLSRQQLHPEIAAAVFSRTESQIPLVIKPIIVDKKTHLIYVEEIVKPTLDHNLREKIAHQLFQNWLAQQRQQLIDKLEIKN